MGQLCTDSIAWLEEREYGEDSKGQNQLILDVRQDCLRTRNRVVANVREILGFIEEDRRARRVS